MTLIKKCNVKMHNAARKQKSLHQVEADRRPSGAGVRTADSPIEANVPVFVDDFSLEHSCPGGTTSSVVIVTSSTHSRVLGSPNTPRE
jgi:hypothetical protein